MDAVGMLELLVVVLAVFAVVMMIRKQYHSNLPLLFYLAAWIVTTWADREINPYLMYSGLAFALVLRFEFMGKGVTKFVAFLAGSALCIVAWNMVADVLANA